MLMFQFCDWYNIFCSVIKELPYYCYYKRWGELDDAIETGFQLWN